MQTTEIGCQQRLWLPPICNGDLPNWGFCAQLQSLFNCRTHGLQFYRIKGTNVNQCAEITSCYFVLHFKTYCEIDFLQFFEHFLWFLHSSWFENSITFKPWEGHSTGDQCPANILVPRNVGIQGGIQPYTHQNSMPEEWTDPESSTGQNKNICRFFWWPCKLLSWDHSTQQYTKQTDSQGLHCVFWVCHHDCHL